MAKRRLYGVLVAVVALFASLSVTSQAFADHGYIYKCHSLTQEHQIAFAKIYQCSSGPADVSIVNEWDVNTGRMTGWISGECAFYAYYQLGWRNMSNVWSHCLSHKDWPTCGGDLCGSKSLTVAGRQPHD
jgi:hypothetical protein